MTSIPTCWILTDGKQGMVNQCLALAESVARTVVDKRVALRTPWRQLSPWLRLGGLLAMAPESDPIEPPWPDIVVACGRQSVVPALRVRRKSGGSVFTVYVQDPVIDPDHFDLVVAPRHDWRPEWKKATNVVLTTGAPNRVTKAQLSEAAARFGPRLDHLPRPRAAVLIGGPNAVFRFDASDMAVLADRLAALARSGIGLMVTTSRRTGAENERILRDSLAGLPAEIWDGTGENPYFGYLALADAVIVTADSVNMVSEAAMTGKPIHVFEMEGGSDKFRAFHENMRQRGYTRPFVGPLEDWSYEPLDDTAMAAAEILRRIAARRTSHDGAEGLDGRRERA